MHTEPTHPASNPEIQYEKTDAHPRPLYHFLFWICITTLFTAAFAWATLAWVTKMRESSSTRSAMAPAQDGQQPPSPRLQLREVKELQDFQKEESEILSSYGVVDKEQGLYRIPIQEAMRLTLQRGLPAVAAPVVTASPSPSTPQVHAVAPKAEPKAAHP
jgi:hypothetical protein